MKLSALFILRQYRAMQTDPARKIGGTWHACSRYGYPFARAFDRKAAVRHVIHFYRSNANLIAQ